MTMATINLLLGIVSIFIALGVALGALAYTREGLLVRGGLRRWNLFFAIILGVIAWSCCTSVGQDFARARDAALLGEAADTAGLIVVVISTLVAAAILAADVLYWRKHLRLPAVS